MKAVQLLKVVRKRKSREYCYFFGGFGGVTIFKSTLLSGNGLTGLPCMLLLNEIPHFFITGGETGLISTDLVSVLGR